MSSAGCTTLLYKRVSSSSGFIDIYLDVYLPDFFPSDNASAIQLIPALIYFHGGGLTVGNRRSWFPTWLHKRMTSAGYAFISADYQLLPPATGHEIVQDIKDVLSFVVSMKMAPPSSIRVDSERPTMIMIDPEAIAVAGTSSGGLCAYLAAMHCISPRPKAILSLYGMGGNFFTSHYLSLKTKPFYRGRDILDPHNFSAYLHHDVEQDPGKPLLQPIADSPLVYHPQTYHIPGYPANPRMFLGRLYLQLGTFLDYYTGLHREGGLSTILRDTLGFRQDSVSAFDDITAVNHLRLLIPPQHHCLFPQFGVTDKWPPTMLVHGTRDSAVPVEESRYLERMLKSCGVDVEIREVEGKEHSFDYETGAEELFGEVFDAVEIFLKRRIGGMVLQI